MPRTIHRMYDSTNIGDIPKTAGMIAVYADGRYEGTEAAARARFPHALLVTITVRGEADRNVCDCETGDLTPAEAARWAKAEIAAGRHPTIYCSDSPWPSVKAAVHAAGIDAKDVSWWIAHYDGDPTIPVGAVAKQYEGSPGNSPGHYDLSSVADYWPGVDPAPKPRTPLSDDLHNATVTVLTHLKDRTRRPDRPGEELLDKVAHQITRVKGL